MQRITRSVALIASVSLLAGACASPSSSSPTQGPSSPPAPMTQAPSGGSERRLDGRPMAACMIKGEFPVKAEIPGLCGTLTVPEDRANPTGRQVALNVALVPALAATPKSDPVFAIAGGPGDASTQFFAWLPGFYADLHATHDIVLVDQRGTGASNEMILPAPPDTSGRTASESDALLSPWARDALASIDADPRFYTSTVAADDLDDIRLALGYDEIDLYGTSYGGTLAQYYLRQHGDHVRVAVLDGATPLDVPVMERIPANSERALALLLSRCTSDPACDAALPNIVDEWATFKARLASGVETNVTNPETGEKAVVTLLNVGPSIHNALRTTAAAASVPLAIHLALEGKWDEATSLVPGVSAGGPSLLMAQEIFCSEAWARFDPDAAARLDPDSYLLPSRVAEARAQAALCRQLPAGVVPADDASAVRTDVPVLWLTGDGDPQDPPANLSDVASQQPNGVIVVMAAQEHVVGHLGCGPSLIAAFIEAGTAAGLDTSCLDQGPSLIPTFRLR